MWFIYALTGAVITGIGQVLVKKGQLKLTPLLDNLIAAIIVNVILVPLLFLRGVDIGVSRNILIYALITATMYAAFYYIISFGRVSLMISLINTSPVVTIALAVSFLHEWPKLIQWCGVIFVIMGAFAISNNLSQKGTKNNEHHWILWGFLGSLTMGIAEFVTKLATMHTDGFTFTFFVYLMYLAPLAFFMFVDRSGRRFESLKNLSSLLPTLLGIFFIEAGLIAIALAYQHGLASLVSPIVASHLLFTAVLAAYFLKERLTVEQKIGILLNLIGVSLIGIPA